MADQPSKWRQEILGAIEHLRQRKTRPDGPRIAQLVAKSLRVNQADVMQDLERLVDEDAVVKVDFKGSISYRDMAKWAHAPSSADTSPLAVQYGILHNSVSTSDRIMEAVQTLSGATSDSSSPNKSPPSTSANSVYLEQLEAHITSLYPETKLRGEQLEKCTLREVDCGRLVQLANNSFVLSDRVDNSMKIKRQGCMPLLKNKEEGISMKANAEDAPCEVPAKRKMNGTRSGLLDMALRKKQRTRFCGECYEDAGMDAAQSGVLLECTAAGCNYATHPKCGAYSQEVVDLQKGRFTCLKCKTCKACGTGKLGQNGLCMLCVGCDNAYHMNCHNPPVDPASAFEVMDAWTCGECLLRRAAEAASTDAMKNDLLTMTAEVKSESPVPNGLTRTELDFPFKSDAKIFGEKMESENVIRRAVEAFQRSLPPKKTPQLIKEIESWTVEDVAKKFADQGSHIYADVIRKQCIDGAALILLTRDDVVLRFGLPFVQALKMYRDICVMCPFGPFSD
ncbi:histone acetyltransferase KAT6A-like [Paramacrobiotus metropolitanus]|uniref:histone acetyltransferase KAT6A-like n=1 Tax=Paramacrobiotus metropolitanus TaxID=2943436 RepID=UPI00244623BA|nr:histone acetyltransferase KAT6A-like [Paramacrobiotus metropolitanus]